MDVVLPGLSEDEIIARVAQAAAANLEAAKSEVEDRNRQLAVFVDEFMQRPAVSEVLLSGPSITLVREQLSKLLADQFTHVLSPHAAAVIQVHRESAAEAIPPGIKVQKWSPDTCDCKILRLLDVTNRNDVKVQSIAAKKGPEHAHLTIGDLHDAVDRENRLKNTFQGAIVRDVPDAAEAGYEYKWSFDDDRNLVVDVSTLPPQAAGQVRALLNRPEFKGKVTVNG